MLGSCLAYAQDTVDAQVLALVAKLRHDNIEERDAAGEELKRLGKAALPALRRAVTGLDVEGRNRIERIALLIETRESMPRGLCQIKGLDEKLASGGNRAALVALLELARNPPEDLVATDYAYLMRRAIPACESPKERTLLCDIARDRAVKAVAVDLLPFCTDSDEGVRSAAMRAMGALACAEARKVALSLLADESARVRTYACAALAVIGKPIDAESLVPLLRDGEAGVRAEAADSIGRLGVPSQAIACLLALLDDPDARVAFATCRTLRNVHASTLASAMVDGRVGSADAWLERSHLVHLVVTSKVATELARMAVDTGDASMRESAVAVLTYSFSSELKVVVENLLGRDDSRCIGIALWALRANGIQDVDIAKAFARRDADSKRNAMRTAAALGLAKHAPECRVLLDDANAEVRGTAIEALLALDCKDAASDIARFTSAREPALRSKSIFALGVLSFPKYEDVIEAALVDREDSVRLAAIRALAYSPVSERSRFQRKLQELSGDKSEVVRMCAIKRLVSFYPEGAFELLIKSSSDHSPALRAYCARTLGHMGNKAKDRLEVLVGDDEPCVRAAALAGLAYLGERDDVGALLVTVAEGWDDFCVLNALRAPGQFEHAQEARVERRRGTEEEFWNAFGAALGKPVKFEHASDWDASPVGKRWKQLVIRRDEEEAGSAWTMAEMLARSGQHTFILEGDCVRVVTKTTAAVFWKSWASQGK